MNDGAVMLQQLEAVIRERTAFVRGIPLLTPKETHASLNAIMGAQQWQERIQAVLASSADSLDLKEAVLAFTSALAHFAAADGRDWKA